MKNIWSILIVALFITISVIPLSLADRPNYFFSDDVFKELPSFPDDLYEVKKLLSSQQIMPSQINSSYYLQPEILPNWDYLSETFYNSTGDNIGQYGLGFYPSSFKVYNVENTTLFLSCIVFCNPGIYKYQGAGLKAVCTNPDVTIALSEKNLLLEPTYPYFHRNWSTILYIQVTVKNNTNSVIQIFEQQPDYNYSSLWKNMYGNQYVTGASILSMRTPRLQIYLYNTSLPITKTNFSNMDCNNIIFTIFFSSILISMVLGGIYVIHKKFEEKI